MNYLLHVNRTLNYAKRLLFNEDSWVFGNYFKILPYPIMEYKAFIVIAIAVAIIFTIILKALFGLMRKKHEGGLGNRPLKDIKFLKDIVLEVHYAACYSGEDSSMIRRCKSLLEMYPVACNIPLYRHKYTPFLRACWNGCAELISHMIRIGANIEATTDAGEGGIYLATYNAIRNKSNNFSAIKILLTAGLDINRRRNDGLTALDLAVLKGHRRLVHWLLTHGAVPTNQDQISMILENLNKKKHP